MLSGRSLWLRGATIAVLFLAVSSPGLAQKDPGVRKGPPGAGTPLKGLTAIELQMFNEGQQRAIQLEGVCDDCSDLTPAVPPIPQMPTWSPKPILQGLASASTATSAPFVTISRPSAAPAAS
jgi:hypothetical protein